MKKEIGLIDIAVIRLPKISNFTDFNILEHIEGVSLRYVTSLSELKNPDMIIIPGTKNTMKDMLWLRQNGLETAIKKAAASNKVIFGVCGGFQMLGNDITDSIGAEEGGTIKGMGLLPMDTVFQEEKVRTRVVGSFGQMDGILKDLSGEEIDGYEIHLGISSLHEDLVSMTSITNQIDGESKADGAYCNNIYGTYVHGIFDKKKTAELLIHCLAKEKNIDMKKVSSMDYTQYKETQYDHLADTLRKHLDMSKIYEILDN